MLISTLANRCLNFIIQTVAILLVIFAVLISTLRIALPYVNNYNIELQDHLNQRFDTDMLIGSMQLNWSDIGPSFTAKNVRLVQLESVSVFVQSIDIQVDFWRSLRALNLVTSDVSLTGAKVFYDHEKLNSNQTNADEESTAQHLSTIFLEQINHFTLYGSQVTYRKKGVENIYLISELKWLNDGERHIASGDIVLDGLTANNLKLQLDIKGNAINEMSGQAYIIAQSLDITPWLDDVFAIGNENIHSGINFTAWLNVKQGQFSSLQLDLGNNEVTFQHNNKAQTLALGYGSVSVQGLNNSNSLSISTTPLSVVTNNQEWAPFSIEAKLTDQNRFVYLSSINLSGLAGIAPLFSFDESIKQRIAMMKPKGIIRDVYFNEKLKPAETTANNVQSEISKRSNDINLVAQLANVSTQYSFGIPGVKNLNGEFIYTPKQIFTSLTAKDGEIDFDKHFVLPIPYNALGATINAIQNDLGWHINVNDITADSSELNLVGDLSITAPFEGEMSMALLASITEGKVENAFHYYPYLLMGDNLVDYLNSALVSGDVEKIQVLYNGTFASFPFSDNSGKFNIDVELKNSEFMFDSDWPSITDFNANLNFTNDSMMITGRSGSLTGLDVTGVEVGIATLSSNQVLTVDASFDKTLPLSISTLMNNSPLKSSVGTTLNSLVISKPISGDFSLKLPLNDTDKALAIGSVNFVNNNVALQSPSMFFTEVNGQLTYQNENINADSLNINWQGLPVTLNVNATDKDDHYETNIAIDANWNKKLWEKFLPEPISPYLAGTLNWQGDLLLAMHHDGDFSYKFDLNSGLDAFESNVPAPYSKKLGQKKTFTVGVKGQQNFSSINATYGEALSFSGELEHDTSQFKQVQLNLSKQHMLLPMPGFHITADLDSADLAQWSPFISDIIASINSDDNSSTDNAPLFPLPERIRGKVNQLDVFGQAVNNVNFNLLSHNDGSLTSGWLLQLNADDIRAGVIINTEKSTPELTVNAEYIRLNVPNKSVTEPMVNEALLAETDEDEAKVNDEAVTDSAETNEFIEDYSSTKNTLANMPVIKFLCDECQIGKVDLGKVSFNVTPESPTLVSIKDFVASRENIAINGQLAWQLDDDKQKSSTSAKVNINVDDLEKEFIKFDFASYIKDSGFIANAELNWQGGPQNFSLNTARGKLNAELDDGYIAKADDKGVRLLSILSLESLVRKLALDFRDIFSDGMFYREIKGDFELQSGLLYTNNTKMKGTAGDLSVKGNTHLTAGLLDYRLSYKPNLTSSLPVIAWITTLNPVTFIAGLALNEVITSNVVSEINYEATGSLTNPDFKEVNRKTRDIRVGRSTPPEVIGEEVIINNK